MAAETTEVNENKLQELALKVSGLAMKLSLFLFVFLFIYVFFPESIFTKKEKEAAHAYDSVRTVIKKDTVTLNTTTKAYSQVEEKVMKSNAAAKTNNKEAVTTVKDKMEAAYKYFILLFAVMLATMLIPRIKSIKASATGIDIDTYEKAERNKREQENLDPAPKETVALENKSKPQRMLTIDNIEKTVEKNILVYAADPQKGKWGSKDELNFRKLTASVMPSNLSKELFDVQLKVQSTNTATPLTGSVVFHLHPTFTNQTPEIYVINGVAELKLKAWGAFTVGAVADNGTTKLELDLAELPNAPELFKSR